MLDGIVWDFVAKLLKDPDLLLEGIMQMAEQQAGQVTALQDRFATIDGMIVALDQQRAKLLDLYPSSNVLTKDLLTEKQSELTRRRADFEKERRSVEAQLNALNTSEQEVDEVRAVCRMAAEGLDHFNSARKKATIELFDVRVTGLWGEIKEEDRLRITGRIPATDLQVAQAVYNLATDAGNTCCRAQRSGRRGRAGYRASLPR